MKNIKVLIALALIASQMFVRSAVAGPYAGAWIAYSELEDSSFDSANALRLTAGYEIIDYLALEVAYGDFGTFDVSDNGSAEFSIAEFNVIGLIPIGERFGFFGRVGLFRWKADTTGDVVNLQDDEDGNDVVSGIGMTFYFPEQGAIKIEYNYYDISSDTADSFGTDVNLEGFAIGLEAHF